MARAGIYKSEVKKARDALLAQGRHPSIDAVRAELGNTGSKTTIHRYLRELEEEEGAGFGKKVAVSEALQDLVDRLAARLHEEAEERISEVRDEYTRQIANRDETIAAQKREIEEFGIKLQHAESTLHTEQVAHEATRQTLQALTVTKAQLDQQVSSFKERLAENDAHRQSLEEKHQHAREALEHYRQAAKDQREQEQRRHEQQMQQLQAEVRTLNQTLIVKQHELTQLHQETGRISAELIAMRTELRRVELENEKSDKERRALQLQASGLEATKATLTERLQQAMAARDEALQLLRIRLASRHPENPEEMDDRDTLTKELFPEK